MQADVRTDGPKVEKSNTAALAAVRVVRLGGGIAAAYCGKLLADAGADVVLVEDADGDPLRRRTATGADLAGEDGALFRFLHANQRAVVGRPGDAEIEALFAGADLVVEGLETHELALTERHPGLVHLSLTPYGHGGPWSGRPASELTLQADSGSMATRGLPGWEPFQCGGRLTEWVAGTYAAAAALAAVRRARRTGHGERIDFSLLELVTVTGTNYVELIHRLLGEPPLSGLPQSLETPGIEPTRDGYVGFCTNSRQQFSDFLLLIERPDLQADGAFDQVAGRLARFDEWNAIVHAWTQRHDTEEIVERASLLRIPVAPVQDAEAVLAHEHLTARGVFQREPGGRFLCPRPPYRLNGPDGPEALDGPAARPAPRLGEHSGRIEAHQRPGQLPRGEPPLPLAGVRVIDLTAWWAGPAATQLLATLGADVIHVESTRRPDGMRLVGGMLRGVYDAWWEVSHFYLAANAGKRSLTLDLSDPRGLALMKRLIAESDGLFDNYSPRVLEQFGLGWEVFRALQPQGILVRMPAFGLSGPWRDRTGFAQTMEQMSGLAWLTGHADDQPRNPRGLCDPLAGMHAAFAFLVALERRDATGEGVHVECAMIEGALNAAAEQLVEWSAYGRRMRRDGNRSPTAAPQGLYPCRGHTREAPQWLALSVETDAQWRALVDVLGAPGWARAASLAAHAGRHAARDAIDARLRPWLEDRERDALAEELTAAGVPAVPLRDPRLVSAHPQLAARGSFEWLDHAVAGRHPVPGPPFRFASAERWLQRPAPRMGEHNREILVELLGVEEAELERLAADGVIGTRPEGL